MQLKLPVFAFLIALSCCASQAVCQTEHASEPLPHFEVATIKPLDLSAPVVISPSGARDSVRLVNSIRGFIAMAYGSISRHLVIGGPSWIDTERFVIEGKISPETFQKMQQMNAVERKRESGRMLQALLADRLALNVHIDSKVMPVYEFVVAKGGLKLTADDVAHLPSGNFNMIVLPDGIKAEVRGMTLAEFAATLQGLLVDRPVVDKTGMPGAFSFGLKISPEGTSFAGHTPESASAAPSFFTAIQDLGLKLLPAKDPVDTVVVDSVSKPSEN